MLYNITVSIQDGLCFCRHIFFWFSSRGCALLVNRGCHSSNSQGANTIWVIFTFHIMGEGDCVQHFDKIFSTFIRCGQVQTGSFLDAAAPNGLFGLGIDMISIPSILAQKGLTSNSFAMCFSRDGIGRISFGDQGSSDQEETPLDVNPQQ